MYVCRGGGGRVWGGTCVLCTQLNFGHNVIQSFPPKHSGKWILIFTIVETGSQKQGDGPLGRSSTVLDTGTRTTGQNQESVPYTFMAAVDNTSSRKAGYS